MNISIDKGRALESAVQAIEQVILHATPGLEKAKFSIESNKIVVVDGVKHEIDIWVEIDHGNEYKAIYIFECKNWEDGVNKNEIIVFSEKIKSVQAQKGFFVAKSFTKDAEAQAKKDKRISLLYAIEFSSGNMPAPFNFHFIERKNSNCIIGFKLIAGHATLFPGRVNLDLKTADFFSNGIKVNLEEFVSGWAAEYVDDCINHFQPATASTGEHELKKEYERELQKNDFYINGMKVERIIFKVSAFVQVTRPPIISHYEIERRGRVLSYAPVQLTNGQTLQMTFISI